MINGNFRNDSIYPYIHELSKEYVKNTSTSDITKDIVDYVEGKHRGKS